MQIKVGSLFACAALFATVTVAAPTSAKSNLIVFGNSLSDVGNTAALAGAPTYWNGRYSNSYVWNEYTAKILGMNLANRAYGGATSNNDLSPASAKNITIPSYHDQVVAWLAANPSPSAFNLQNDLVEVEIGGNDILHRVAGLITGTVDLNEFASQLAASVAKDTQKLVNAGYKNIAIWNLPAVDKTPMVLSYGASALFKPVVAAINSAVKAALQPLSGVRVLDLNNLMEVGLQPAVLAALGITDSTHACYVTDAAGKVTACANPDEHLFADGIHPASRMHYLWGAVAAVLARNPAAVIDTAEALKLIGTFGIGQSSRDDNIIADGFPTATASYSTSSYVVPTFTTSALPKCH
ncbi:hypothetical protein IW146_002511 [Coemansia sp. RSA 922]|nr:hypothetical protein H4S03_005565 [Coemansia sp. S3946]KAJ2115183.1 hypothetical protein IW146_002511 [Coemansia sp. RSA 922]KAJ2432231.1 hypothetical protein GGF41_000120 [Coemansia sp. RSA 2531]